MQTQFIKSSFDPMASEITSFGDPIELFNVQMLGAAPVNAKEASKDFSDFVLTAKVKGALGNNISITLVEPEEDGDLTVGLDPVDPNAIVVTLAKSTTVTTTGAELVAALNENADVAKLVTATGTGSSALSATAKTNLEGGVNGTYAPSKGVYFIDSSYIYFAVAPNSVSDDNWRRVSLGSAY